MKNGHTEPGGAPPVHRETPEAPQTPRGSWKRLLEAPEPPEPPPAGGPP